MDNERILRKIEELMELRGMTRYRLSKMSGIKQSTLTTMLNKRSVISISSLDKICRAFGLQLSEFFAMIEENREQDGLTDFPVAEWEPLPSEHKQVLVGIMQLFRNCLKKS